MTAIYNILWLKTGVKHTFTCSDTHMSFKVASIVFQLYVLRETERQTYRERERERERDRQTDRERERERERERDVQIVMLIYKERER